MCHDGKYTNEKSRKDHPKGASVATLCHLSPTIRIYQKILYFSVVGLKVQVGLDQDVQTIKQITSYILYVHPCIWVAKHSSHVPYAAFLLRVFKGNKLLISQKHLQNLVHSLHH
jgi:hypothetical protein